MCLLYTRQKSKTSERRDSTIPMMTKRSGRRVAKTRAKKTIEHHPSPRRFTAYVETLKEGDAISLHSTTTVATNESLSPSGSPEQLLKLNTTALSSAVSESTLFKVFGKSEKNETTV